MSDYIDSRWLQEARKAAASRDILDALRDAEQLASELRAEFDRLTAPTGGMSAP